MDLKLTGRRALVTGGSRGIGRAIVDALVAEGAIVSTCARGAANLAETVAHAAARGANVYTEAFDVRDVVAYKGWFERSVAHMGGLDIVISNVSTRPTEAGEQMWRDAFDSDLMHHLRLVESALPFLKTGTDPNILFIASIASVLTNLPPGESATQGVYAGP